MPGSSDRAHHPYIPICENSKDPCSSLVIRRPELKLGRSWEAHDSRNPMVV
jgi:hypothetical protein